MYKIQESYEFFKIQGFLKLSFPSPITQRFPREIEPDD
jgi:hypothetical protein